MYGETALLVVNRSDEPVAGATVYLISRQDSTIVDARITDVDGRVTLGQTHTPALSLLVNCIGYEDYSEDYASIGGKITLSESATALSEVVVTANPESLSRKSDRFIFTPVALKNEVSNTYDILKLTPLIQAKDSYFSIIGKGNSLIYINGRNPRMEPDALVEMLKALPASQIIKVEIITSPGSSHSASTSGGIINVVIDQPTQGYIGSLSAQAEYFNERLSPRISVWNGYSHDRLNLGLSASYAGISTHDISTNSYDYTDIGRHISNETTSTGWRNALSALLNVQYDISSKATIGVAANITAGQSDATSTVLSYAIHNNLESVSQSVIKTVSPWQRPNYGFYGYYTLVTAESGSKLDITADYTSNLSTVNTDYDFGTARELQQTIVNSNAIHFNPKFELVITDKHSLNFGYDLFRSKIDNDVTATTNSNVLRYKELINSGYAEWKAAWSQTLSTSVGLRVENSDISGEQSVSSDNFERNYTDFFPTVSISFDLPGRGNQNISFDVARYIYRPFYTLLNPFVYWTSETTCRRGNTDQHPEYAWELSLYYSFLNDFVYGATYSASTDALMDYTYQDGDVTVSSTRNFGNNREFSTFISYNHLFGGFWRVKSDARLSYSKFDAWLDGVDLGRHSLDYSFNILNSITLSRRHAIRVECNYALYSPIKSITDNGKFKNLLSIAASKKFTNALTISLEANNLLGFKNDAHYTSARYSYREHRAMYPAQVTLKLNYLLGKPRVTGAPDRYNSALNRRFSTR
jgi:hypothetical protein